MVTIQVQNLIDFVAEVFAHSESSPDEARRIATYLTMPRAQDPEVNFNWVSIITTLPGASAEDIERELTGPLEDAIKEVKDIKFVSSSSRENS